MDVVKACNHANSGGFVVACTGELNRFEKGVLRGNIRFSQAPFFVCLFVCLFVCFSSLVPH